MSVKYPDLRALVWPTVVGIALILAGCGEDVAASRPDIEFPDSVRSKCPESPFRPEFPIAPKVAVLHTVAAPVNYDILIYTSRGKFIREMKGVYDPNATNTGNRTYMNWDGRDEAGNYVPSGYYILGVKLTNPVSGFSQGADDCIFWLNEADRDKLK